VRDTIDVATARAPVLLRAYFFDDVQGRRCRGRSSRAPSLVVRVGDIVAQERLAARSPNLI
jgi:hypothetical protein